MRPAFSRFLRSLSILAVDLLRRPSAIARMAYNLLRSINFLTATWVRSRTRFCTISFVAASSRTAFCSLDAVCALRRYSTCSPGAVAPIVKVTSGPLSDAFMKSIFNPASLASRSASIIGISWLRKISTNLSRFTGALKSRLFMQAFLDMSRKFP